MRMVKCAVGLSVLMLVGCESTGLSPRENGSQTVSSLVLAIQPANDDGSPQTLHRPMRLAVAQVGEVAPPTEFTDALGKRKNLFSSIDVIPAAAVVARGYGQPGWQGPAGQQITEIMSTARQIGADNLLLIGGTIDQSDTVTPLSALDLTIIGMFIVPSHDLLAEGKATAALIDLQSGRVVAIASASAMDKSIATEVNDAGAAGRLDVSIQNRLADKLAMSVVEKVQNWTPPREKRVE